MTSALIGALNCANMVVRADLNQALTLGSVYESVAILPIPAEHLTGLQQGKRLRIPFFGVNDAIVSIRFDMKSRGVRNTGGQLRNVVAIDLQTCGKNVHLKISERKMIVTGALSEEMGVHAFRVALTLIWMCQGHLARVKALKSEEITPILDWLMTACKGDQIADTDDHTIRYPDPATAPVALQRDETRYLLTFAAEYANYGKTYKQLLEKWAAIIQLPKPMCETAPTFHSPRICNAIYQYCMRLSKDGLSLVRLSQHLCQLGYGVFYNNNHQPKLMYVATPIAPTDDTSAELPDDLESPQEAKRKKNPTFRAHRFTVYQGGAVRQCSPTNAQEARMIRDRLLNDIGDGLQINIEMIRPLSAAE